MFNGPCSLNGYGHTTENTNDFYISNPTKKFDAKVSTTLNKYLFNCLVTYLKHLKNMFPFAYKLQVFLKN